MDISLDELEKRRIMVSKVKDRMHLDDNAFYPVVKGFEKPDETENTVLFGATDNYDDWLLSHFNCA